MAGLFARDQARAVARQRPDWRISVGLWGHHDGALSARSAAGSARALAWRLGARPGWRDTPGPLHETLTPRLSWTLALAGGGVRGLLSASRRNLQQAQQRFGRINLIHAHVGFPAGWVAAQLATDVGCPYVLTEHMSPFPFPSLRQRDGRLRPALRLAFERAAATVAVSPALAAEIRAQGLPCTDVIANGVDETRFVPTASAAAGTAAVTAGADPFVLFTLGALVPQKGVDVLLRALSLLQAPQVELHVGGAGPERAALQRLAAQLGVADRVRWLGALRPEDTPAHHARCSAFVLASRHETFGVVLAEALMCGKPVVATRCGGPEAIVNAGNGLLVPAEDAASLAAAIDHLVANPARYNALHIRADAVARFGFAAVGSQLAALYERVVA